MQFYVFALVFIFAAIFAANAHNPHKDSEECDPDHPCPPGEVCHMEDEGGWCIGQECDADQPCPPGYECHTEGNSGWCINSTAKSAAAAEAEAKAFPFTCPPGSKEVQDSPENNNGEPQNSYCGGEQINPMMRRLCGSPPTPPPLPSKEDDGTDGVAYSCCIGRCGKCTDAAIVRFYCGNFCRKYNCTETKNVM